MWQHIKEYVCENLRISFTAWEQGQVVNTAIGLVISVAIGLLAAAGFELSLDPNWTQNVLAGVGVGIAALIFVVTPFRMWRMQRIKVVEHEEAAKPKLSISPPIDFPEPKHVKGRAAHRTWKLRITNDSATAVRGVQVKQKSLINNKGGPSRNDDMRFRVSTDKPQHQADYEYEQAFDLNPKTGRLVDIALYEEFPASAKAWLMYAFPGKGKAVPNEGIDISMFPHALTIEISAENVVSPLEKKYELLIDEIGRLCMAEKN